MAAEYQLTIAAADASATNPQNGEITVTIGVRDVNDNAPTFGDELVLFSVAEDTAPGTAVWNFSASDADSGPAGTVRWVGSGRRSHGGLVVEVDRTGRFIGEVEGPPTVREAKE